MPYFVYSHHTRACESVMNIYPSKCVNTHTNYLMMGIHPPLESKKQNLIKLKSVAGVTCYVKDVKK